eukprot:TRINITY_DN10278_c0_g2_i1.p1 TRINITY_DN10278_c0_g2~~TRINITY_DN10278_c0_g2_i1.p1  ORF type:complete len:216 (+),score=31.29 TRINITY_DN10278_c0_g2_i1:34-681(+)
MQYGHAKTQQNKVNELQAAVDDAVETLKGLEKVKETISALRVKLQSAKCSITDFSERGEQMKDWVENMSALVERTIKAAFDEPLEALHENNRTPERDSSPPPLVRSPLPSVPTGLQQRNNKPSWRKRRRSGTDNDSLNERERDWDRAYTPTRGVQSSPSPPPQPRASPPPNSKMQDYLPKPVPLLRRSSATPQKSVYKGPEQARYTPPRARYVPP